MTRKRLFAPPLLALAIIFVSQNVCYAHSLRPIFLGPGPAGVFAAVQSIFGAVLLMTLIAAEALVLWRSMPETSYWGNLWRAAVILLSTRAVQLLPVFADSSVIMGGGSDAGVTFMVTVMVLLGIGSSAILLMLLYRGWSPSQLKVLCLALAMEIISSGGLYLGNIASMKLGFLR